MGDGNAGDRDPDPFPAVVADSSPLIGLQQIEQLRLLPALFGAVLVPPAVRHEIGRTVGPQTWLVERPLTRPIDPRILGSSFGAGETEAIALALEVGHRAVLLDERAGRRLAATVGLSVVGTVGVLVRAKQRGFLSAMRPAIDALLDADFFIATGLYRDAVTRAGERW